MRSMTGFGRGVAESAGARATVDLRAVNHRFLDIKLRGPQLGPAIEDAITARLRATIDRGAIAVAIHVARADSSAGPRLDRDAARAAHAGLVELARELGVAGPDLALVLAQPGVVVSDDDRDERAAPAVLAALDLAIVQLEEMRAAEGAALARELATRIDELAALRAAIAELATGVPELVRKRLHERLRRLVGDDATDKAADAAGWLDPSRLAQEVALYAERADVTEELVRLTSHLDQARALLGERGAPAAARGPGAHGGIGRRLDFLAQELGRELNTIGSKSALAEITARVVEAKAVLEKLREQIQNVE